MTDEEPAVKPQKKKGKKRNFTERLQGQIKSLRDKWTSIAEYKEKITAFVTDEANKKTFRLIWRQLKAVIRHLLPTKVRVTLVLGFEDPALTGNVLAVLSILYGWYGDAIQITPVFDEKILEGEGSLKGRIRAGTLLAVLIRILLNKNFRVLVRRWRRNGGIL